MQLPTNEHDLRKIEAAMMVLDVTVYCLACVVDPETRKFFQGQIDAAIDAYESVSGEESMNAKAKGS